jgi:hypothetical protein
LLLHINIKTWYLLGKPVIMKKGLFFGWNNLKWFIREYIKMYSSETSFFSKKRVESGVAFIIAQWGMIFFLLKKYETMTTTDFAIWSGIEFFVAGYMVYQIQQQKKLETTTPEKKDEEEQLG